MALQPFVFPFPETRLLNADGIIFKFKIRPGNTFRCVEFKHEEGFHEEFEEIVRTVLGNLNNLIPFFSTHYTVYPYKKPWKSFTEPGLTWQQVYPHVLVLYLEKNLDNGIQMEKKNKVPRLVPCSLALKPKRRRTESPLEEAIIKELAEDMEVRSLSCQTGKADVENQHAGEEVKEDPAHVAKKTSKGVDRIEDTGYMGAEEEDKEEDEDDDDDDDDEDEDEDTPAKGGFLSRLARYIFSLFSREQS